jgi:RNA polymerase sigma-70 factor (ECF subfamily)
MVMCNSRATPSLAVPFTPPAIPGLVMLTAVALDGAMQKSPPTLPRSVPPMVESGAASALDLMAAIAERRDRDAFAQLYAHFTPRLKAYLMRQGTDDGLAEEVAQEAMLTVWHRAGSFDPAKAGVSTWIFTIARNKRIDRLRRERFPEVDPNDPALVPLSPALADSELVRVQDEVRLRQALRALPPEQAELLNLAFFQDKSHSTIADQCSLPLGTVKSRIRLALQRLRNDLKDIA